ncbi:putative RNA-binding protein, YhbY family [Halobacteroides halobius DSM 5150]|uniref:Putative RNA-binding protein, YhbY family n=1 Tax=Halobacteroides halobius (strain ATCC 35273 / DSM 5150 / MD-1) TaxID=748449 RepID=L0KBG9_HALHC|nr:ribosome assembly RNA-binding protein YhbY [Halobacteroides halobius]AGB41880.1 putative RNA-binding protein, YhbY family [Halobacteroides halobius DSM 5150]
MKGKQRAYLRGQANQMDPLFQIGKNGITDNVIEQVDETLEARELIKLRALENSLYTAKEAAYELAESCDAEVIQTIGNVFVLYRRNDEDPKYNLPS